MRGFSDRVEWMILEAGMLFTAVVSAYVGYSESDQLIVVLSFCLAVMTLSHHKNTHF